MDEVNVHRQWRESVLAGQISSYQLKHSHNTFFFFTFCYIGDAHAKKRGKKTIGKRTLVILSIFIGNISYVPYCPVLGVLQYNFFSFLNKTKYVYCKPIWVFSLCGSSELTFQEFVRNILVFFFWKSSGFFFLRSIMAG